MPTLDDLRAIAAPLPGAEERATTGGAAWFVRNKLFAWECHPWPSIPDDVRAIIASELVVGVKVAEALDALALREMQPDVFLPRTTGWGEPKIAFRMARIDADHLAELVVEAWRVQAPKYLQRQHDAERSVTVKGVRPTLLLHDGERMSIHNAHLEGGLDDDDRTAAIERVVAEVEDDIRHGRVTDDMSVVLGQRLEAAGITLTPAAIDELADAIETDVSL